MIPALSFSHPSPCKKHLTAVLPVEIKRDENNLTSHNDQRQFDPMLSHSTQSVQYPAPEDQTSGNHDEHSTLTAPPSQPSSCLRTALASKRRARTGTRLEKKRETDRESQRAVRERTRNYISHLESLVETFQKSQQDERLQSMARQCQELRDENERLKSIFTGVMRMIRGIEVPKPDGDGLSMFPPANSPVAQQQRHDAPVQCHYLASYPLQHADSCQNSLPCAAEQRLERDHFSCHEESHILARPSPPSTYRTPLVQMHPHSPEIRPIFQATNISEELLAYGKDDAQLFAVIGNALRKAQESDSHSVISVDPERDADIVIPAIVHGWQTVERSHSLDSTWHLLRYIDQNIFSCCGSIERLAILRLLRLKLQDGAGSAQRPILPPFMRPRPVQNFVEHAALIDYIVWPELREYLILNATTDSPSYTAAVFASSIRFVWPFDLSNTWTRNDTGLYSFSNLFNEKFQDIRCWAMSPAFFDLCPQLIGYIPVSDPVRGILLGSDSVNGANSETEAQTSASEGGFELSAIESGLG